MAGSSDTDRIRRGLQITVASVLVWAAGVVLVAFFREHYQSLALAAADEAEIRAQLANLRTVYNLGGLFEATATAAILLGLVTLWRGAGSSSARGPLAVGLAGAGMLLASWGLLIATDTAGVQLSLGTWSWLIRAEFAATMAMWIGLAFAVPRLREGLIDLRLSAVVAALTTWWFGLQLWDSFSGLPGTSGPSEGTSTTVFAIVLIGAATLVAVMGRRALRDRCDGPEDPDDDIDAVQQLWVRAAAGLRLAAGALTAQVIICSFGICLLVIFILYGGAIIFLVPIAIATAVASLGMLRAARTPNPAASTMAAGAALSFLIALAIELQFLFELLPSPHLELCWATAELLGTLFTVGYIHRVACEVGDRDIEAKARALHVIVLVTGGGATLSGDWLSSKLSDQPAGWILYVMFLLAACLAGIVILLSVASTASRLSRRLQEDRVPVVATARIESKHE